MAFGTCGVIHQMVKRGMIQSLSVPQKKQGAGRVVVCRRTPDLRLPESSNYPHLTKIFEVTSKIEQSSPSFYSGFDPTGASLHLGHLTVIAPLLFLAKHGFKVLAVIGGVTSRLGDPAGKSKSSKLLERETLTQNSTAITNQLKKIFQKFSSHHGFDETLLQIINNETWYSEMTVNEYSEKIGKYFKLADVLDRSVVKSRLQNDSDNQADMRFSELVYQTFQAYDWLHLYKSYNCCVQIGGNDQLGNIEDGYTYIWKCTDSRPNLAGITVPLVVTNSGEKLGKSAGNAVWLDPTMTDPEALKQYLLTLSENELHDLMLKLTYLPTERIQTLSSNQMVDKLAEKVNFLCS